MKPAAEIIRQAKLIATERKKSKDILMTISAVIESLQSIEWDKQEFKDLESLAGELSSYMFTLSKYVTEAKLQYNCSYTFRKIRGAELYFELDCKTQSERQRQAEKDNQDNYIKELIDNYYADIVTTLQKDLDRMVSVVQSMMANKRAQLKTINTQT